MTVDFLLIGAAKSATTSLSNALSQHPDICFSNPKEPEFFCKDNWRDNLTNYHALFSDKPAKLYGEGSTNYSKFPHYNKNIHTDIFNYNPNMKIIYMMRHPIDRIVSHYIHSYNRGHESIKDINTALTSNNHYIDTARYAMQIEPYINYFGRNNVLLLFFEDFISNPQQVLNTTFDFLNINGITVNQKTLNTNKSFNRRVLHHKYDQPKTLFEKIKKVVMLLKNYCNRDFISQKPKLTTQTKVFIMNNIADDIKKIEALTNRDLSHWSN
ncbi:sulfotransferase family protein [Psychroserpens mesophilus]|uniref:sulfotransferase family protein n=1 Tax=Psychroserpens mesophilus TaxID=325473 RepID=UPI00058E95A1|nr:sulfotransferase [Psychroserpens mesophilus]